MVPSVGNSETILLQPLASLIPGSTFLSEATCVDITLSYTGTGGSFSISLLKDSVLPLPIENTAISLPFGRVGIVKSAGTSLSSAGLLDTISGPVYPVSLSLTNFYGIEPNDSKFLSFLAGFFAAPAGLQWSTLDIPIKNFSYRGPASGAISQLAGYMLGEVTVRKDAIYITDPGASFDDFVVQSADIVSINQVIDYSLDVSSILNPALTAIQVNDDGDFVYDSDHAQKQTKFTVQAGAPGSQGSQDFIPIPDGWLVDGNYEEWTPASSADLTNPSASVGRYWKVFQSPTNPGMLRGITNFTRLVKQVNIPGNVSSFVGSPVTGLTKQNTNLEFDFAYKGTESGIYGFNSQSSTNGIQLFDVVSHQFFQFNNAIVLVPHGSGSAGDASSNFYSITMETWTFPRVNPQVIPIGDPVNPFGISPHVVVVNPSGNIPNIGVAAAQNYYNKYLSNYKLINSPRLRTTISVVYRNLLPQVGDNLQIPTAKVRYPGDCGRIQTVTLRFGRSGMTVNIVAERYQYGNGFYQGGTTIVFP